MGLAFPILSERVRGDSALLQRALRKAFDFMLIAGLAGALLTSALAPYIVRFLAPASFGPASVPMAIIAWAIPVTFANMVLAHLLVAGNYQFQALPVSVAAIVLNAALNVVLIPALGPSAPALVTVISETAGALGIGALVIRRYGFGPSATAIIKIAVVTAATALTLFGLQRISPIGAVAVGAVVFGGGLWQLRVIDRHDLALLLARPAVG
jgi:O-antigen/teichoic acid export membrane protein